MDIKKEPKRLFFDIKDLKIKNFRSEEQARETTMFLPCRLGVFALAGESETNGRVIRKSRLYRTEKVK